jgi:hypothetical protein
LVLAMQSRNQFENCLRRLTVKVPGGLIRQQQFRTGNERTRQSYSLLLPARKLS